MGGFVSLSLDLGSTFGWCKGSNGVIAGSGEVVLSATGSHPGHRWLKFQEWLASHKDLDEIFYENVTGFRSSTAAMVYGALKSQLEIFCVVHGIRMCSLKPGQIKGDFTGNGNAPKEDMCNTAINLGWKHGRRDTRDNNNECDAIALFWSIWKRRLVEPSFADAA